MAKKKKTLPKDFDELLKTSDIGALKAIFDDRELDARGGYGKGTALHCYGVPEEFVRWLVEQGADVNAVDDYQRTPLDRQATIGSDTVKLLLELGAEIRPDKYGQTPLHTAAGFFKVDTVRLLIEWGADVHAEGSGVETPLSYALARTRGINIPNMAKVAALLLDAGAKITPDMAKSVERTGKDFEFHRENFNEELLEETEAGLRKLYELFNVEPIVARKRHDGVSPITVAAEGWKKQHHELWEFLVPSQGPAKTVQGEAIRISGRVADELYRNGGVNWDANYRKMLNALLNHFSTGTPLPPSELAEAKAIASDIKGRGDDDEEEIDRLCELSVKWVLQNPAPVQLEKPNYNR